MTPQQLDETLLRMPARDAQVLWFRFVDERSEDDCAQLYGVDLAAYRVLLWRAAQALEQVRGAPAASLPAFELEALEAQHLAEALLRPDAAHPRVASAATLLLELQQNAPAVRQARQVRESSPQVAAARAKENWLRRGAMLLLLALAGYFYLQQKDKEGRHEPRPTTAPRAPNR